MSSDVPVTAGPKLPVADKRNILITSALPYVNNVPHLGNIIGSTLSGDVYARFCRLRGHNAIYICGTDEYGTATETKAQQLGVSPQELCDKYNVIHKKVYDWFDIQFDYFGRTTTPKQTAIAQDIFKHCDDNGFVCQQTHDQLFCARCDRFLADRFVNGTCYHPGCGSKKAQGDQCADCGQLIDPLLLVEPWCEVCKATPERRPTTHLYLDLAKLEAPLRAFVKEPDTAASVPEDSPVAASADASADAPQQKVAGKVKAVVNKKGWSENAKHVTKAWLELDGGLQPRAISRDLKWGTPVPKEGFEKKVFYVWFDAPIGYISITANYTASFAPDAAAAAADTRWQQWWQPSKAGPGAPPVELTQFLGKDNIPFHTIIFPATLLAANDGYQMLSSISSTEYLQFEGLKFSKSRGVGVFGDNVVDSGVPVDAWRYYLLAIRPETDDTNLTWDDFASKVYTELPNTLGNLVNRVLAFIKNKCGGVPPAPAPAALAPESVAREAKLQADVSKLLVEYVAALEARKIKEALGRAMAIAMAGNDYMSDARPWHSFATDRPAADRALATLYQLIHLLAVVFEPFMPTFARTVYAQLAVAPPAEPLAAVPESAAAAADADAAPAWPVLSVLGGASHVLFAAPGQPIGEVKAIFHQPVKTAGRDELAEILDRLRARFGPFSDFPMALKVGEVKAAGPHPDAAKTDVYVLSVDCGEAAPRQIVSGVASAYPDAAALVGRRVAVLTNLKPVELGGVRSEGMLLTGQVKLPGSSKKGNKVLSVDGAEIGAQIVPQSWNYTPAEVFDVKADLASLKLIVGDGAKVLAGTSPLMAGSVEVTVEGAAKGARIK